MANGPGIPDRSAVTTGMQGPGFSSAPAGAAVSSQALSGEIHDGLTVQLLPASLGKRVVAFCIDVGIISSVLYLALIFFGIVMAFVGITVASWLKGLPETSGDIIGIILLAIALLIFLLLFVTPFHAYFIYFELKKGATPGKKIFGLKVVSLNGKRLSLKQCVYRDLLRWYVDVTLILPGIITILATEKNQRLGDLLAGTMVVHSAQREARSNFMYITQEQYHLLCDNLAPKAVPLAMCEQYLSFAFPEYISLKRKATVDERSTWEARARQFLPASDKLGLDQETVLLFFAEHCFQLANQAR